MNIYDMMKSGMDQEAIFIAFKEECAKAQAVLAKEEAEAKAAEQETKKEALMAEGRAHAINAVCAYLEALGEPEMAAEDIAELEEKFKEFESGFVTAYKVFKEFEHAFDDKQEKKMNIYTTKMPMDDNAIQKAVRDLLKGKF
jgi:cbb3-type cytochrome oxidase cytochrome c subunit